MNVPSRPIPFHITLALKTPRNSELFRGKAVIIMTVVVVTTADEVSLDDIVQCADFKAAETHTSESLGGAGASH